MAGDVHTWGVLEEDQWVRQRVQSMDAKVLFRKVDQPWRQRVFSVPANTVRVKYGRQRRIITDEFDILLEKGMKRMCNGRPASQSQILRFPMILSFIKSLTQRGETRGKLKPPQHCKTCTFFSLCLISRCLQENCICIR